jgi:hypothetical protein
MSQTARRPKKRRYPGPAPNPPPEYTLPNTGKKPLGGLVKPASILSKIFSNFVGW